MSSGYRDMGSEEECYQLCGQMESYIMYRVVCYVWSGVLFY